MQRLVIVGGGFAGVWAALGAARQRQRRGRARSGLAITLMSRDPWLTIRPRLYEASLDHLRVPLDETTGPAGVERVAGEVTRIDTAARTIAIAGASGPRLEPYDRLILAAGSHLHRPEIPGARHAFAVDTHGEAVALHRHLRALTADASRREAEGRFTAVVVGAGFTGIEVATALVTTLRGIAERARAGDRARLVLVEGSAAVAPDLGAAARAHVEQALASLGIESRTGTRVTAVGPDGVTLSDGERLPAATTVWTGGFRADGLTTQLAVPHDALGRLPVDEFLRVRGADGVFAAGDVARAMADADHVAPMSCQYAIPMGERAGANAAAELLGLPPAPFAPAGYVTCLDLGEAGALFMEGWERAVRLTGFWATLMKQAINTRLIYPPRGREVFSARAARAA